MLSFKSMRYVHHKHAFYKQDHTHDLYELAYYVDGFGTVSQGGQINEYRKGTIHLIQNGILHDENNKAESKIILVYFTATSDITCGSIYRDTSGEILSILRTISFEMQENLPFKQEMLNNLLMQIILLLKRKELPAPSENIELNRIVRYIDENFQFDLDVHKIASKTFYSYDRFRHLFKEHVGLAPYEYINNKRVDLAKFLIEMDPSISLSMLAKECGYKSLSHFSNSFLAKTGKTPSAYKKYVRTK